MKDFDPTKPINVDDMDQDAIDKMFERLSPEGAEEIARNFGAPNIKGNEKK